MAETPSTMLALGSKATTFTLKDAVTDKMVALDDVKSNVATVIMFICNHCPYVKHIQKKLTEVAKHYQEKNISFIAINSNDIKKYPADRPEMMRSEAITNHYTFPYLFDATQEVARKYHAACTPDFYVFDADLKCVYRGRFDDATPGNRNPVTGKDLTNALDALLAKKPISDKQFPSLGCNIKWVNN